MRAFMHFLPQIKTNILPELNSFGTGKISCALLIQHHMVAWSPVSLLTSNLDKAFLMMHSVWKEMSSHRHIAYWVQRGRGLRYTPASTTENDQHIEKTEAPTVSTRVNTSLDSSLPVDPVVEPPEQISLQTLFSDCSPELLEAGVEQGVNMLERLKEPPAPRRSKP